jgi:HEAT repeat protein
VANGLLGCANTLDDPEAIAALLELCGDPDPEVRWDALWEAMEHLDQRRPDVQAAIQLRTIDPDRRVRDLALRN